MPKIIDHKEYKKEILHKVTVVFQNRGYGDLSMRDISKEIQVSIGALYHYFPSKDDLFKEMFTYMGRETLDDVVTDLCGLSTPEQKIDRLFDYLLKRCDKLRSQFLLTTDLIRNQIGDHSDEILYQWSSHMQRSMTVLIGLPRSLSATIFTFLSGALYNSFVKPQNQSQAAEFKVFKQMLFAYLKEHKINGKIRMIQKTDLNLEVTT